jgi:O-acetyl-ADP-ribose deacetylase (regulator of RNase III)
MWLGGLLKEDEHLRQAYTAALDLAHAQGFRVIAFPSMGTGIFDFPVARGAAIAARAVAAFCAAYATSPLREIRFTIIDAPTVAVFQREITNLGLVKL